MRLSIIIPVYNAENYLVKCLESILEQDIEKNSFEVIIVDDGSLDDSHKIAKSYADIHQNIRLVNKQNGGVGSARNRGLDEAKGNYIYFIDPDDYLLPNVLNTLVNNAEANTLDIITFGSKPIVQSKENQVYSMVTEAPMSEVYKGEDYIANYKYKNEVWWYIIRSGFLNDVKVKFIEGRWMEDAIFTATIFLSAKRMAHMPVDGHRYVKVEGSAMTSKESNHYNKVIDDNRNAAFVIGELIGKLEVENKNSECINRLKVRQQSFVFFMMVRMLKSSMGFQQIKAIMESVSGTRAYPLDVFLSNKDYQGIAYSILVPLFNNKRVFYMLFILFNPLLRLKNAVRR